MIIRTAWMFIPFCYGLEAWQWNNLTQTFCVLLCSYSALPSRRLINIDVLEMSIIVKSVIRSMRIRTAWMFIPFCYGLEAWQWNNRTQTFCVLLCSYSALFSRRLINIGVLEMSIIVKSVIRSMRIRTAWMFIPFCYGLPAWQWNNLTQTFCVLLCLYSALFSRRLINIGVLENVHDYYERLSVAALPRAEVSGHTRPSRWCLHRCPEAPWRTRSPLGPRARLNRTPRQSVVAADRSAVWCRRPRRPVRWNVLPSQRRPWGSGGWLHPLRLEDFSVLVYVCSQQGDIRTPHPHPAGWKISVSYFMSAHSKVILNSTRSPLANTDGERERIRIRIRMF